MPAKTYNTILKYGTQSAYEALTTKDSSVLYFTDAGKLYKGDLDMTQSIRVVDVKPVSPVAGITYVIKTPTSISVEFWDGSEWVTVGHEVVTSIGSASTDLQVPTAKAAYTAVNIVDSKIGSLADLTTTAKAHIVAAVNEVAGIANDNTTAIGVTPTTEVAGSGIRKDIYDIQQIIGAYGTAVQKNFATVDIGTTGEDTGALPTVAQIKTYVAKEIKEIEGALHFKAVVTPTAGQSDEDAMNAWYTAKGETPKAGDVFIISTSTKEYIVSEVSEAGVPTYREIGSEGMYVLKTQTIAGLTLDSNISKEQLLTAINVEDGAQANFINAIKVNDTSITLDDNTLLINEGSGNGNIRFSGHEVHVHGLGSAAYTDTDAYDAAGTAANLVGNLSDLTTDAKTNAVAAINEVDAHADAAQVAADAAQTTADQNTLDIAALAQATTVWGSF